MIEFQEINEKFKTFQKIGAYILTSLNYFFTPMSKIWKKVLLLDPVPLFGTPEYRGRISTCPVVSDE